MARGIVSILLVFLVWSGLDFILHEFVLKMPMKARPPCDVWPDRRRRVSCTLKFSYHRLSLCRCMLAMQGTRALEQDLSSDF